MTLHLFLATHSHKSTLLQCWALSANLAILEIFDKILFQFGDGIVVLLYRLRKVFQTTACASHELVSRAMR